MIRALHVDAGMEWRGGQRQVLLAAAGMAARGVEVTVACPPGSPLAERAVGGGLTVAPLRVRGELDLGAAALLSRLALRHGAAVVHAHCARSHSAAWLASAFGRPWRLVVTRRTAFRARRNVFSRLKHGLGVDRYVAVSEAVRAVLVAAGAPAERVQLVPDGIELPGRVEPLAWRSRLELPAGAILVGSLGALAGEKGHADLVAALAHLGDARLHVVIMGTGPEAEALARQADAAGVAERVHLVGFVDDVAAALAGLDLYVQPSRAEGLGSAVLDAMAAGLPVVATRAGGLAELVEPERSGLLVPPGESGALAGAVGRVIADAELRGRLAAGARDRAAAFSADAMVDRLLDVYRALAEER